MKRESVPHNHSSRSNLLSIFLYQEQYIMDSYRSRIKANREKLRLDIQKICVVADQTTGHKSWKTDSEPKEARQIRRRRKTSTQFQSFESMSTLKDIAITENFQELFSLCEKVGEGAQSTVYRCVQVKTENVYAVKIAKKKDLELMENMRQCYQVLKQLSNDNIIKGKYLFLNQKKLTCHLVEQYVESSDLRKYMNEQFAECRRKQIACSIGEEIVANIIKTLVNCLAYMREKKVCHRDLKPDNIMYNPVTGNFKIIDFQLAKMQRYTHEKLTLISQNGTLHYRAPQTFKGGQYGIEIDMWAAGIIAFEMLTGKVPFRSSYRSTTIDLIVNKEIEYEDERLSAEAKSLLSRMLQKNPEKRISPKECLSNPFFLKNTSPSLKLKEKKSLRRATSFQSLSSGTQSEQEDTVKTSGRYYDQGMKYSMADTLDQDMGIRFCEE